MVWRLVPRTDSTLRVIQGRSRPNLTMAPISWSLMPGWSVVTKVTRMSARQRGRCRRDAFAGAGLAAEPERCRGQDCAF